MIAQDIFNEFKKERKKIGFKRTFTRRHKNILRIIAIFNIVIFGLIIYLAILLNLAFLIPIAIIIGLIIFFIFISLLNNWDLTDYDECNDRLLSGTRNIILNAFNRLKIKSNIYIENTITFIDYIIDYINNLDEDSSKKKELALKIFTIIVFPIILGVVYSLFNKLDIEILMYIIIGILIASLLLLFLVVEFYEIFFLASKKIYIRKSFLQILQILKSSINLNTSSNMYEKDVYLDRLKEVLFDYLDKNKVITIKQTQDLLKLSYSKSKDLLDEFTDRKSVV